MAKDIDQIILAWWKDQSEDYAKLMAAFDKLSPDLRTAVNDYPLNVLPETVLKAVRAWGEPAVLDFLRNTK